VKGEALQENWTEPSRGGKKRPVHREKVAAEAKKRGGGGSGLHGREGGPQKQIAQRLGGRGSRFLGEISGDAGKGKAEL